MSWSVIVPQLFERIERELGVDGAGMYADEGAGSKWKHAVRRRDLRVRVPIRSVSIAAEICVVYALETPGGLSLIGRTPVPFFDLGRAPPVLMESRRPPGTSLNSWGSEGRSP